MCSCFQRTDVIIILSVYAKGLTEKINFKKKRVFTTYVKLFPAHCVSVGVSVRNKLHDWKLN